jgi:hypothetical protein
MSPVDARYLIRRAPYMTPGDLSQAAYQASISPTVSAADSQALATLAARSYAAS